MISATTMGRNQYMNRIQYSNKHQHEVEHNTRDIMETRSLILNEAVKDTSAAYRATPEDSNTVCSAMFAAYTDTAPVVGHYSGPTDSVAESSH